MFYWIFRAFLTLCLRVFYRRIEAPGLASVPAGGPLLLVANHGNALLDPLLLLVLLPRRISFLAKHPLFSMPVIGFFLKRIGGIPVYRRQDTPAEAPRNEAMFGACREVLEKGGVVCIFPEGVSHDRPRLEPVKTGAARIFFSAAGRSRLPVKVIPVGINFEEKEVFRSRVLIFFGRPVPTQDLPGRAMAETGQTVGELTHRIEKALESLTPGLDTWEELEFIREIRHLYLGKKVDSLAEEAVVLKRFIEAYHHYLAAEPGAVQAVRSRWEAYQRQLSRFSLTDAQVDLSEAPVRAARFLLSSVAVILMVLPLASLGLAVHFVPYSLCGWVERRFNRHPDLAATFKLLAAVVLFPTTYLVCFAILVACGGWKVALPALGLLPVAGWASLLVVENRQRMKESVRALYLAIPGGRALREIQMERQQIIDQVGRFVRDHAPSGAGGIPGEIGGMER